MSDLEVRLEDGALWLTLNRPEQFNALTGEMVVAMIEELRAATARDDVRVVVLTGSGPAFSAGADLGGDDAQEKYDAGSVDGANLVISAITELDKPVVCGLNGVAAGVGMSVALACDLVVATESAALTLAFTKIGLMPDGGATATVAASVGRAKAMRLALLSDVVTAQEAFDAGLVSHVFPDDGLRAGPRQDRPSAGDRRRRSPSPRPRRRSTPPPSAALDRRVRPRARRPVRAAPHRRRRARG